MNILFDSQIFYQQKYGGISRYFCSLATQLSKIPNTTVTLSAPLYINDHLSRTGSKLVRGYRIKKIPRGTRKIVRLANCFISILDIETLLPHIVHETYYSSNSYTPKNSIRVITVHDMIYEQFPNLFSDSHDTIKHKKNAIQRANHIICVSKSTRNDLMNLYSVHPRKISVIYHGVEQFPELPKSVDAIFKKNLTTPYLLFVGSRKGYKNFSSLLYAFSSSEWLKNNFKIIAFGGGRFDETDSDILVKAGLTRKHVIYISGNDYKLSLYYKNAVALVYPSLYEGFGLPILEAMHFNCPVICSNISSLPEVAGSSAEYFVPDNIDSIRTAIENILTSSEKRIQLVKSGALRSKLFTWERCAKETFSAYQVALQNN